MEPIADSDSEELIECEPEADLGELKESSNDKLKEGAARPIWEAAQPGFRSKASLPTTARSDQDQDPFSLQQGPITRSQTRRLKNSISALVYSEPGLNQVDNQDQKPSQLFTHSVFGLV